MISEAKRRKRAVWVRAGRGVLGRWVVRKVLSQVGEGVRCLVVVRWREIWEDRLDCVIALLEVGRAVLWKLVAWDWGSAYCPGVNCFLSGPRVLHKINLFSLSRSDLTHR